MPPCLPATTATTSALRLRRSPCASDEHRHDQRPTYTANRGEDPRSQAPLSGRVPRVRLADVRRGTETRRPALRPLQRTRHPSIAARAHGGRPPCMARDVRAGGHHGPVPHTHARNAAPKGGGERLRRLQTAGLRAAGLPRASSNTTTAPSRTLTESGSHAPSQLERYSHLTGQLDPSSLPRSTAGRILIRPPPFSVRVHSQSGTREKPSCSSTHLRWR